MKNTKSNVIRVIKAMADNKYQVMEVANHFNEKEMARDTLREIMILEDVLQLFADTDYFNKIADIYDITD